jgi:hypothetical protein
MKFILCMLFSAAWFPPVQASTEVPEAFPASRYDQMMARSPFALATPVAPPTAPGFAANLYVTGLAKVDGRDFVSISSRDLQTKLSILSGDPAGDGISLVSVQWSDELGKSKVTLRKGAETAVIGFDEMAIKSALVPNIAAPPQPGPVTGRPQVIPQIPRPLQQTVNSPIPQPTPFLGQPAPGQTDTRRRIRIINSRP